MWYNQNSQQIFGHKKSYTMLFLSLYPRFSERLWQWDPVHRKLVRVGQKVPFIFSLLLTFRENLREREWKTKIMTRKVTWHYMAVSPCFSPIPEPFCVFHLLLLPHPREKRPRNKIFCHQTCATGDLSDIVFWQHINHLKSTIIYFWH